MDHIVNLLPVPVAARLLRLGFRIPPGTWMFVCCDCCVLSGRGLCKGLITRTEESYRLWRVVVCDQETSKMRRLKPATGLWKYNQKGCNATKTNNKQQQHCKSIITAMSNMCHNFLFIIYPNATKFLVSYLSSSVWHQ